MRNIMLFAALILLVASSTSSANVVVNDTLVFGDGSKQSTATMQGPVGLQGAKGDQGIQGPTGVCNIDTLCDAIIASQREVPAFCIPLQTDLIGVWRTTDGAAFTYLALFSDNTFLFADNDLSGTSGVEVGTYSINGTNITFNVVYDRNGTGSDSGIGDIGTPSVIDSVLSNNGSTLTIGGGGRILNRAAFNTAPIVNVWRATNGAAFSYLVLFADNTFMYAEKSSSVVPVTENGLESGTYSYDGSNLTFNLTYDDNGPGQNSGVGNIGTPSIISAAISTNGNTLTIAGAIVLTKVF